MNLEALAIDVVRPALEKAGLNWHGWHAFRRGLATNLHRFGVSDKVIQQILRHANVVTTINIYVKTVTVDAANAMKSLETLYLGLPMKWTTELCTVRLTVLCIPACVVFVPRCRAQAPV